MKNLERRLGAVAAVVMAASICAPGAGAAEIRRLDGIHRIAKKALVTDRAVLGVRDNNDNAQCGTSMNLCPSSLDGGCCPDNYACAKSSCLATTKGPSTCGSRVGWHVCDAVYGGGCCPDGYLCETAGNCVPPSGASYTYGCPRSQHLCPASMSYGCCPNGMACAVDQCYSTGAIAIETTMLITSTKDNGRLVTHEITTTEMSTAAAPTALPTETSNGAEAVFKYFPSSIPKESAVSDASDNNDSGGGGLSKGALGGIIAGAIAFLIIVIVAAYIIIRHLNKVVAAVGSARSHSSKSRPQMTMKDSRPTDSDIDAVSVDPSLPSRRPGHPPPPSDGPSPLGLLGSDYSSTNTTPGVAAGPGTVPGPGGYHRVPNSTPNESSETSFEVAHNAANDEYFRPGALSQNSNYSNIQPTASVRHMSDDSRGNYSYAHLRHGSNASESTDGQPNSPRPTELEARERLPELPNSPSSSVFSPTSAVYSPDSRRRSNSGGDSATVRPSLAQMRWGSSSNSQQRARGESVGQQQSPLGIVSEEIHGFHGPSDHLVGQTTTHRPPTQESVVEGRGNYFQGQ